MRALTVCQPYAALIAAGWKRVENRDYATSVTGPLAIHAGKSREWLGTYQGPLPARQMQFGAVVATCRLAGCVHADVLRSGKIPSRWRWVLDHDYAHGPWLWILEEITSLPKPLPARGSQGFWQVDLGALEPEGQITLF